MRKSVSKPAGAKRVPAARKSRTKDPAATAGARIAIWVSLSLIVLNLVIYVPVLHYGFLSFDDPYFVSKNDDVAAGLTWQSIKWAFTTGHFGSWHPVTWLSHMLDVQLFGMDAGLHHLTSLLLHIANTLLLFWAFFRMTKRWGPSALVAALFATHPLHVESVAWIAERKDVLSTLFWMLTLHAYIAYVRRPGVSRYLAVAGFFVLGLMSKTMLVTLPAILLLLDIWPLKRLTLDPIQMWSVVKLAVEKAPLAVLSVACGVITLRMQWLAGTVLEIDKLSLGDRIANSLVSYIGYMGKMLWPATLAAFYPLSPVNWGLAVLSIAILALISILAVKFARQCPPLLVGWLWYLLTLLPVIGLVQVGGKSMADRFTYVPLTGLFVIIAWGVAILVEKRPPAFMKSLQVAAAVIVCTLALSAREQARYWESDVTLWEHALEATGPDNYFAQTNLAVALAEKGDFDRAILHYKEALRSQPGTAETHNALGVAYARKGLFEDALTHYDAAVQLNPDLAEAHSNRGTVLAKMGKEDAAVKAFQHALKLDPDNPEFIYNLGFSLADMGRLDEAIIRLQEVVRLDPEFALAYNRLGNVLLTKGEIEEAISNYRRALSVDRNLAEAHNNLGVALRALKRDDEAIVHFREALRINLNFAEAHNNMGLALVDRRQADAAINHFTEALRLRPGSIDIINNLGYALMLCNRNGEAIACFNEVLRMNPGDARAQENLAVILRRSGGSSGHL